MRITNWPLVADGKCLCEQFTCEFVEVTDDTLRCALKTQ